MSTQSAERTETGTFPVGVPVGVQMREAIGEIGRPVIARSRDAGVLFGNYAGNNGPTVHLMDARQMWQWRAAKGGTLIDCAVHGVIGKDCKFSVASATVTVFRVCAMIDCEAAAADSIRSVEGKPWR